jgi:SAM-dependent methyltransferase
VCLDRSACRFEAENQPFLLRLVLRFVIRYAYAEDLTMVNVHHYGAAGTMSDEPAMALFQKQWQLYRKVVDYNYLFHREAYNCLHRVLVDEAIQPFRFLDVACGDASATVEALKGTQVASYHGIDLSQAALELASQALETLACPVTLDRRDFVEALRDRPEPMDVAWIGL